MIYLINKKGSTVLLNEIGAGIVSIIVPDRNGEMGDVVLGYKDSESYRNDGPCAGKIPGRFANRISCGQFILNGRKYQLERNAGRHHLHGGSVGFANKNWEAEQHDGQNVTFHLESPDGDQGYPGRLNVCVHYNWNDENILTLDIKARSDKDTVVNLTNHTYWNLAGENSGSILDQELQIFADKWLPTDEDLIPTGEISSVKGTPMDFLKAKKIGKDINADFEALRSGKGYDNCWILNGKENEMKKAAELYDPASGRLLEIFTDQPAVQVYTGNWLSGSPLSKSGRSYNDYDGVAIECQDYPDAPNKKNFPSAVLMRNETYHRIIQFKLSLKQ